MKIRLEWVVVLVVLAVAASFTATKIYQEAELKSAVDSPCKKPDAPCAAEKRVSMEQLQQQHTATVAYLEHVLPGSPEWRKTNTWRMMLENMIAARNGASTPPHALTLIAAEIDQMKKDGILELPQNVSEE